MEKTGKAYAFFDCRAPKKQIEAELPNIRELAQAPNKLELSLMEATENPRVSPLSDPSLYRVVKQAKDAGMKYFLEATYEGATNKETADELASILNRAYQSPLYKPELKEPFRGAVVYKENDEYVFRE